MHNEPSDASIIETSVSDPRLFADIFERHAEDVRRFLARRIGQETAASLLSEVFRIAFERRAEYDLERATARPWLFGIGANLLLKHRRAEARRIRATGRLAGARAQPERFEGDVDSRVDAERLFPKVAEAVATLPDDERHTLLLFVWEELSYAEISSALQIPIGTVRSRISRARKRIRELVHESGEEETKPVSDPGGCAHEK